MVYTTHKNGQFGDGFLFLYITSTQLANRCGKTKTFIYGTTGKRKNSKLLLK